MARKKAIVCKTIVDILYGAETWTMLRRQQETPLAKEIGFGKAVRTFGGGENNVGLYCDKVNDKC